jgi:uncharacterized GH25 family protein
MTRTRQEITVIIRSAIFRQTLAAIGLLWLFSGIASAAETRIEKPTHGGGHAVLVLTDHPLKAMTETPFAIELYDAQGKPVKEAKLTLSLDMPFMPMPPNHPVTAWAEDAFRGVAVFTMAGAWQVHVVIEQPGAAPEKLVFDIEMVVMQ